MNFIKSLTLKDTALFAMLFLVIFINAYDFVEDILEGDQWLHLALEVVTVGLSIGGVYSLANMIKQRKSLHAQVQQAETNLSITQHKLNEIGKEYSKHIKKQFIRWQFTQSEKEVALLILKGLSFKEIAASRNTKEKTVRQQASSVYSKSNVASRHELAAWFFEDLLMDDLIKGED